MATAQTCPLCGTKYRYRDATLPPPLPNLPMARPTKPSLSADDAPLIRTRPRRRRDNRGWLRAVVVFLFVSLCAGGVLYLVREDLVEMLRGGPGPGGSFQKVGNFSFRAAGGWQGDESLREKTRANLAVSLAKPRGHMTLYYLDHQSRSFSDSQQLDQALKRLRAYFPQLEYQDPFKGESDGRSDTLGGEQAIVFTFSGTDHADVPVRGQAYVLSRQGYTYWLFFWGPEDNFEALTDKWEELRQGFKLYNEREGWKPRPREMETFTGPASAYLLRYPKDLWKAESSPKEVDPACVLHLRGLELEEDGRLTRKRDVILGRSAEVMVLSLPKGTVTLDHLKKKLVETNPMLKVEALSDRARGKSGGLAEQVNQYRFSLGGDNDLYAVIAVTNLADGPLSVVCECRWDRKDYWEQEFKTLVESLARPEKAAEP